MRIRDGTIVSHTTNRMLIPFAPKIDADRLLDLGRQTDGEGDDGIIGDTSDSTDSS